ncbi:hypothetical protein F7230_04585 [Corynebacterium sp. 320]|uniref:hypothetical protein n=1 Tax=Corynebacterium TaxID=1716 RepID=UPI00125CC99F|nr:MULTISPECIES: hypothetical protein [Corynebacterium]KAB1554240.1 hypothetical protein F7232_04570 [Corynebacterium sp. 319]KAB1504359.1 hypothetical protein F7230_04585 [Corynebacterium sp. 320]KAB3528495.1 hypothetical protein F8354_04585 [Corynebacterium sp. 250]KAB3540016.1 hypothetical protein F8390_01760 [Corynebacterium sp. 366]QNP92036.1 hypothetical protein IAU67_08450 [Corynebacterium zhongnanshanii]
MTSRKHKNKNKAHKRNNSGGKHISPYAPAAIDRSIPDSIIDSGSYKSKHVQWTAREIDDVDDLTDGLSWELSSNEAMELLKFLDELRGKTWNQCENESSNGRRRNHDHAINELPSEFQKRLNKLDENEERIFRFRLSGKCRLWGFRSGALFRILWYDREHSVYPVSKRHT